MVSVVHASDIFHEKKWQNPKNISLRAKATHNDGALVANGYFLVNEDEENSLFFLRPSLRNILRVWVEAPVGCRKPEETKERYIFFE